MPPIARDLADPIKPRPSNTLCSEIFKLLMDNPDLLHIPIVDEGRPIGLIGRLEFMLIYVRMYGPELWGRKPVSMLMNCNILIVEAETGCEDIHRKLFEANDFSTLRGFIVQESGLYLGVCSTETLLRAMADIMKHKAEELEIQRSRAEAANYSKTQFLASMSHELRTPLNAIIGFADLIRMELFGPITPPRYLEYVHDIQSSGTHLLHMINDLLDMAKIEAGRFDLREDILDPAELGLEVLRILRQSVENARVELDVVVPKSLPHIRADEQQIRRILINLLSNAIKFTPAGGRIVLSAKELAEGGLEIVVADTGIGIEAHKLDKVLEPFEQVENSLSRSRSGTGLGLPLTKAMIEAHGGKLVLKSEFGKGTEVHAILPPSRIVPQGGTGQSASRTHAG